MTYGAAYTLYSQVNAQPPALYFPPALPRNQIPMLLFMRAGDMVWNATGRFIHLVYATHNVVDPLVQLRDDGTYDWFPVEGTGFATAQVMGLPAVTFAGSPYTWTGVPPAATTGFGLRIGTAAFDEVGGPDPNARYLYDDASQAINVAPNPASDLGGTPIRATDVFELAVCTIVVCTP